MQLGKLDLDKILNGLAGHLHSNTSAIIALFILLGVTAISAAFFVIRDLRADKRNNKKAMKEYRDSTQFNLKDIRIPIGPRANNQDPPPAEGNWDAMQW